MIEVMAHDPGERDARDRTVTVSWLAHYWSVHEQTIYRDIRKGALKAYRLPSGQLRIRRADAEKYGRPVE